MNTASYNRLRSQEINLMNEDDKGMHIFYTLEDIENVVKSLHKILRTDDPMLGQRIVQLEQVIDTLNHVHSRADQFNKIKQEPVLPGVPA